MSCSMVARRSLRGKSCSTAKKDDDDCCCGTRIVPAAVPCWSRRQQLFTQNSSFLPLDTNTGRIKIDSYVLRWGGGKLVGNGSRCRRSSMVITFFFSGGLYSGKIFGEKNIYSDRAAWSDESLIGCCTDNGRKWGEIKVISAAHPTFWVGVMTPVWVY